MEEVGKKDKRAKLCGESRVEKEPFRRESRKKVVDKSKRKPQGALQTSLGVVCYDRQSSEVQTENSEAPGCTVSLFDCSVENHFRAMDMISKLCGDTVNATFEEGEIDRISSTITFLREWRYFNYKSRDIKFASETGTPSENGTFNGVTLPQFSAAVVPQAESISSETKSLEFRKDFVLYVGGPVWGLDWCPRLEMAPDCQATCEFLAVSAHPPDSAYHKLGAPLSGRGMIQIWSVLSGSVEKESFPCPTWKPNQKSQKKDVVKKEEKPKKPRGRPRKDPSNTVPIDSEDQFVQAPAIEFSENSSFVVPTDGNLVSSSTLVKETVRKRKSQKTDVVQKEEKPKRARGRPRQNPPDIVSNNSGDQFVQALAIQFPENSPTVIATDTNLMNSAASVRETLEKLKAVSTEVSAGVVQPIIYVSKRKRKSIARVLNDSDNDSLPCLVQNDNSQLPSLAQNESAESSIAGLKGNSLDQNDLVSQGNGGFDGCSVNDSTSYPIPKDVILPRVVLCLGHDGRVAWDVKWRPSGPCDSDCKHRMGYLAVALGNGSIEVWEIPSPKLIRVIYSSRPEEGTDPRFVKLRPVFRCSILKCGDRYSIPLTVEWSTSFPHNLILAGCHDGVVALWKFSTSLSTRESRPLLCFSADTVPIRALAWAPAEGDAESSNIIVTTGHEGLKFWDLRDPFRPLWDLNPAPRFTYSLDWLPHPRCIITSYDDGTLRILSLVKAASDVPVTGKPFSGTQQQGLHSYYCSPFSIWNVQVSRLTGMVAYCGADGNVLYFQLTVRAAETDPVRNRAPHFLCGSLTDDGSAVTVITPSSNSPYPMKRSANEWGNIPTTMLGFIHNSNREKRGKERGSNPDDQVLALCYDDDSRTEGTEEPPKTIRRCKTSGSKKQNNNQTPISGKEDLHDTGRKTNAKEDIDSEIEVLPSKVVAMHRVRWNMNRGSERWLCYGGAAGIVRCQVILPPEDDKKPSKKGKLEASLS